MIQNLSMLMTPKKVRIGSRVPEENREWLKRHGIVTDLAAPKPTLSKRISISKADLERPLLITLALIVSCLPLIWLQQHMQLLSQNHFDQTERKSLQGSNYHLRASLEKINSISLIQQSLLGRMSGQINGLQKGEAMSDALHHVYDDELGRMSYRYDMEVETLRKHVFEKEQMISSLETSLQSMDGVVVRANSLSANSGMTNGSIAAVNEDFQFVVVNIGALKGAQMGQKVELYHDGALIGYGQVEKVYPEFSGVKVFSFDVLSRLQKGDEAFLKSSSALS